MAPTSVKKKVQKLYDLMARLAAGEEIYPQNARVQAELEVDGRTLRRYLEEIHDAYGQIVTIEKKRVEHGGRKVTLYRVVDRERDVSEVFRFFLESGDDLGWLLQLVHENDPRLLREYSKEAKARLSEVLKEEERIFRFVGTPFENLDDPRLKEIFLKLRIAVKNHEYRNIDYHYRANERIINAKCLKLLHANQNWYVAIETAERKLRILRLAFIRNVKYSKKTNYQPKTVKKYAPYFNRIQNAMTLDRPFVTARLLALPKVALYFEEGMKSFFPSQRFVKKRVDGSVEFVVSYTQPMEILPFVKRWQPDLRILEPRELREMLVEDLREGLENNEKEEGGER